MARIRTDERSGVWRVEGKSDVGMLNAYVRQLNRTDGVWRQ
jgi:hypothetical protein